MNFIEIKKSDTVQATYPDVHVWAIQLNVFNLQSADWSNELKQIHAQWKGASRSEVLKSDQHAHYTEFMKSIDLNIKITPPSVANLIIRCFTKDDINFPHINPVVDAVNIAALLSGISLGVFDAGCVEGQLELATSGEHDQIMPIGEAVLVSIEPNKLILRDDQKVLSIFSIRDSQVQAITSHSTAIWLLGCQVPGVSEAATKAGMSKALEMLERIGGTLA